MLLPARNKLSEADELLRFLRLDYRTAAGMATCLAIRLLQEAISDQHVLCAQGTELAANYNRDVADLYIDAIKVGVAA